MWLARPLYESMPYLYMIVGGMLLAAAWLIPASLLPTVFLLLGALSFIGGLVLWLRRKDYRARQAEYNSRSLDE